MAFQRTLRVPTPGLSVAEFLASFDSYTNQDRLQQGPPFFQVAIRKIGDWRLTADVYAPLGEPPFPALVLLHGGGWVLGNSWTHRRLAADLAGIGLLTVVVDYRRAPKHPFPAAVEDTAEAIGWVRENAAQLGVDEDRLLAGGDSAGANLVAAAIADATAGELAAALLCYGVFDFFRALPVTGAIVGGPDPQSQLYLKPADLRSRNDPRIVPEQYAYRFPPSLVLVGEDDPLLAESESMAKALSVANVPCQYVAIPEAPHGFLQLPTHPSHDLGMAAITEFLSRTRSISGSRTILG